jgi:hypothetical protein
MTEDKRDDQWLNAIAGRIDPELDPELGKEAELVRNAFLRVEEELDSQIKSLEPDAHLKILERVEDQMVREKSSDAERNKQLLSASNPLKNLLARFSIFLAACLQPRALGGIAASCVLVLAVVTGKDLFVDDGQLEYAESMKSSLKTRGVIKAAGNSTESIEQLQSELGSSESVESPIKTAESLLDRLQQKGLINDIRSISAQNLDISGLMSKFNTVKSANLDREGSEIAQTSSKIKLELRNLSSILDYLKNEEIPFTIEGDTITIILEKARAPSEE